MTKYKGIGFSLGKFHKTERNLAQKQFVFWQGSTLLPVNPHT